jgi:hypothetical protein
VNLDDGLEFVAIRGRENLPPIGLYLIGIPIQSHCINSKVLIC